MDKYYLKGALLWCSYGRVFVLRLQS